MGDCNSFLFHLGVRMYWLHAFAVACHGIRSVCDNGQEQQQRGDVFSEGIETKHHEEHRSELTVTLNAF